jgi:hypothetical protein
MTSVRSPTKPLGILEKDGDDLQRETEQHVAALAYRYAPLPGPRAFRVLVLLPGQPNSRLECQLNTHDLDAPASAGSYTAVSYTWGASKYDRLVIKGEQIPFNHPLHGTVDIRHPVYCGDKRILVSTNLYNLLRRMRDTDDGIALWIDAICINQDDFQERARQVMLMRDIYSRADNVVLWMGEEDGASRMGFALASKLAHHPAADPTTGFTLSAPMTGLDLINGTGLAKLGLPPDTAPDWQALFGLFERPVFRRSWVIQEMALATSPPMILCGEGNMFLAELIGATAFLRSCGWLELLQAKPQQGPAAEFNAQSYAEDILRIRNDVKYRKERPHIALVTRFDATDARDKIYAMLGLLDVASMPEKAQTLLQPDYRKPVEQVYCEATLALIETEGSLAVLSLAGTRNPTSKLTGLPTWVPDFSTKCDASGASLVGSYPKACPYNASGNFAPDAEPAPRNNPRHLGLRAFRVGTVAAVAQQDPNLLENAQLVEWIGLMKQLPLTYAATGEEIEEALWRTLVGNRDAERGGPAAGAGAFTQAPRVRDSFHEFIRAKLLGIKSGQAAPAGAQMLQGYETFTRFWMYNMIGRRFFFTKNGLMGMGPATKPGDLVFVVAGAPVPLVVRPEGSKHRLIGDCYVHGIMDGQVMRWSSFSWSELVLE